ncbi:SsgA family sporulation/cell division regulator [Streptomyces sp. M19]
MERELEMNLVLAPERGIPVPARLTYRTQDPYAVHVTFHIGSEAPVDWTFARELLVEGCSGRAGRATYGSGRRGPRAHPGLPGADLPDGEALLEAPASAVSAWLERTLRVVPPGSEHEQVDVDDALGELLAHMPCETPWPGEEAEG